MNPPVDLRSALLRVPMEISTEALKRRIKMNFEQPKAQPNEGLKPYHSIELKIKGIALAQEANRP